MDFPLQLNINSLGDVEFVYGMDELRQDLYVLLKSLMGTFTQSPSIGTLAVPHVGGSVYLESSVRRCCEQLRGVSVRNVYLSGDYVVVDIVYNGDATTFEFSIQSF